MIKRAKSRYERKNERKSEVIHFLFLQYLFNEEILTCDWLSWSQLRPCARRQCRHHLLWQMSWVLPPARHRPGLILSWGNVIPDFVTRTVRLTAREWPPTVVIPPLIHLKTDPKAYHLYLAIHCKTRIRYRLVVLQVILFGISSIFVYTL